MDDRVVNIKNISDIEKLSFEDLLILSKEVERLLEIYNKDIYTNEEILIKLTSPTSEFLNQFGCYKNTMKHFGIIRKVMEKTNFMIKSYENKYILNLKNQQRPYLFELLCLSGNELLEVRSVGNGFVDRFINCIEESGFSLGMEFTRDDYIKLFMYANKGGRYKISLSDECFKFHKPETQEIATDFGN